VQVQPAWRILEAIAWPQLVDWLASNPKLFLTQYSVDFESNVSL
jgi:hypothetical protein